MVAKDGFEPKHGCFGQRTTMITCSNPPIQMRISPLSKISAQKIRDRLDWATFEGKRRILEMLDVRGTLAIESDEKVIYLSCLIAPQPVSLALILPLTSCHGQNTITLTAWVNLDRLYEQGNQTSLAEMLFSRTNLAQVG
jgi:hypothetical protein